MRSAHPPPPFSPAPEGDPACVSSAPRTHLACVPASQDASNRSQLDLEVVTN